MHRLSATIRLDLQLQARNGFYHAVAFVLACWFILLTRLPDIDWSKVLPAVVFGNLVMVNFYFVAGLVLLEKGEGTLAAQAVTPLSGWEYLLSKVLTLTALSLVEQFAIVWSAHGNRFALVPMGTGIALAGVLYTLVGFLLVARYRSINEFLLPSVPCLLLLSLPLLQYFDLWGTWILYLHPFTSPLALMSGAFRPIPAWQSAGGALYATAWAGLLLLASLRAFDRFIVEREGVR